MKKLFLLILFASFSLGYSQNTILSYEQLTSKSFNKTMKKKLEIDGIKLPDSTIVRVGDIMVFGEPAKKMQVVYSKIVYEAYSGILEGSKTSNDIDNFFNDKYYAIYDEYKGKKGVVKSITVKRKKRKNACLVYIVLKLEEEKDTFEFKNVMATLETLVNGELLPLK